MKKLALLVSMLVVFATGSSAWAAFSGTMNSNTSGGTNTSGGLVAINALVGSLTWTVSETNGVWDYNYVYTPTSANKNQGVGAISIQFGIQPTDLVATYTYSGDNSSIMGTATTTGTLMTIDRTLAGSNTSTPNYTYDSWLLSGNPTASKVNVTTTFQGLQWIINTAPKGSASLTLDLKTSLAPVWGDFYMDGYNSTTSNGYGFVRNTGYDATAPTFKLGTMVAGYIPTPSAVPIPPSVLLFGSGLSGLFFFRRKKIEC